MPHRNRKLSAAHVAPVAHVTDPGHGSEATQGTHGTSKDRVGQRRGSSSTLAQVPTLSADGQPIADGFSSPPPLHPAAGEDSARGARISTGSVVHSSSPLAKRLEKGRQLPLVHPGIALPSDDTPTPTPVDMFASRNTMMDADQQIDYEANRQRLLKYTFSVPYLDRLVYGFHLLSSFSKTHNANSHRRTGRNNNDNNDGKQKSRTSSTRLSETSSPSAGAEPQENRPLPRRYSSSILQGDSSHLKYELSEDSLSEEAPIRSDPIEIKVKRGIYQYLSGDRYIYNSETDSEDEELEAKLNKIRSYDRGLLSDGSGPGTRHGSIDFAKGVSYEEQPFGYNNQLSSYETTQDQYGNTTGTISTNRISNKNTSATFSKSSQSHNHQHHHHNHNHHHHHHHHSHHHNHAGHKNLHRRLSKKSASYTPRGMSSVHRSSYNTIDAGYHSSVSSRQSIGHLSDSVRSSIATPNETTSVTTEGVEGIPSGQTQRWLSIDSVESSPRVRKPVPSHKLNTASITYTSDLEDQSSPTDAYGRGRSISQSTGNLEFDDFTLTAPRSRSRLSGRRLSKKIKKKKKKRVKNVKTYYKPNKSVDTTKVGDDRRSSTEAASPISSKYTWDHKDISEENVSNENLYQKSAYTDIDSDIGEYSYKNSRSLRACSCNRNEDRHIQMYGKYYEKYANLCKCGLVSQDVLKRNSVPKDIYTDRLMFLLDDYMEELHISKFLRWETNENNDRFQPFAPFHLEFEQLEFWRNSSLPEAKEKYHALLEKNAEKTNAALKRNAARKDSVCSCSCDSFDGLSPYYGSYSDSVSLRQGSTEIPSFDFALCAICERTIPVFLFERHTNICSELHNVERDVTQVQETLVSIKEGLLTHYKNGEMWLINLLEELIKIVDDIISVPIPDPFEGLFTTALARDASDIGSYSEALSQPPIAAPVAISPSPLHRSSFDSLNLQNNGSSNSLSYADVVTLSKSGNRSATSTPRSDNVYNSAESVISDDRTSYSRDPLKTRLLSWKLPDIAKFVEAGVAEAKKEEIKNSDGAQNTSSSSSYYTPVVDLSSGKNGTDSTEERPSYSEITLEVFALVSNLPEFIESKYTMIERLTSLSLEYKIMAEKEEEAKVEIGRRTGTLIMEPFDPAFSQEDLASRGSIANDGSTDMMNSGATEGVDPATTAGLSALSTGLATGAVREVGGVYVRDNSVTSIPNIKSPPLTSSSPRTPVSSGINDGTVMTNRKSISTPSSNLGKSPLGDDYLEARESNHSTPTRRTFRESSIDSTSDIGRKTPIRGDGRGINITNNMLSTSSPYSSGNYIEQGHGSSDASNVRSRGHMMSYDEINPSRKNSMSSLNMSETGRTHDLSFTSRESMRDSSPSRSRNVSIGSNGRLRGARGSMHIDTSSALPPYQAVGPESAFPSGRDTAHPFSAMPSAGPQPIMKSNTHSGLPSGYLSGSSSSAINIPIRHDSPRVLPTMMVGKQKLEVEMISSPIISPRIRGLSISSVNSMSGGPQMVHSNMQPSHLQAQPNTLNPPIKYNSHPGSVTPSSGSTNFNAATTVQPSPSFVTPTGGQSPMMLSRSPAMGSPQFNSHNNPAANLTGGNIGKPLIRSVPSIKDFDVVKPISKGAYGSVFLAKKRSTAEYFAIKILSKADMVAKNQVTNIKAERMILTQLDSEFIVKLFFSFQSNAHLYLVMEYLSGGDCASLLKAMGRLDEAWCKQYCSEITEGLLFLHSKDIIHRDLKPDNVLIDPQGHVRLTDFGLSRMGFIGYRRMQFLGNYNAHATHNNQSTTESSFYAEHFPKHISESNESLNNNNNESAPAQNSASNLLGVESNHGVETGTVTPNETLTSSIPGSPSALNFPNLVLAQHDSPQLSGAPSTPGSPLKYVDQYVRSRRSSVASISSVMSDYLVPKNIKAFIEKDGSAMKSSSSGTSTPGLSSTTTQVDGKKSEKGRFAGTPDYIAPESIVGLSQGASVDWWSLGVMVYEFLVGVPPFHAGSVNEVFDNILKKEPDYSVFSVDGVRQGANDKGTTTETEIEDDDLIEVSKESIEIMKSLLLKEPSERLDGTTIKRNAWFEDIDWDHLLERETYFVPKARDPEDTDYFDARGATNDASMIADEPSLDDMRRGSISTIPSATMGSRAFVFPMDLETDVDSTPGSRKSSLSGSLSNLQQSHSSLNIVSKANEPDFGYFSYKNLPALEKLNNETVNRLKTEFGVGNSFRNMTSAGGGSLTNLASSSSNNSSPSTPGRPRHASMSLMNLRPTSAGESMGKDKLMPSMGGSSGTGRQRNLSFNEAMSSMPLAGGSSSAGTPYQIRSGTPGRQSSTSFSSGSDKIRRSTNDLHLYTDVSSSGMGSSPGSANASPGLKSPYSTTGFGVLGRRGSIPMRPRTMSGSSQRSSFVVPGGMPMVAHSSSGGDNSASSSPSHGHAQIIPMSPSDRNSSRRRTLSQSNSGILKVLVVEYDATVLKIVSMALQSMNCFVTPLAADDARMIRDTLIEDVFDVIVVNADMASVASLVNVFTSGKLRTSSGKRTPVIGITGKEDMYELTRIYDDVFSKPLKLDQLQVTIDALRQDSAESASVSGSMSSSRRPSLLRDVSMGNQSSGGRRSRQVSQVE